MADRQRLAPPDSLELDSTQMRVLLEPTRMQIATLLSERPATTSQLAEALGRPKGTIGHHCKVMEEAGLIAVVHTRRVRAIDEKYYGRTARTYVLGPSPGIEPASATFLGQAATDLAAADRSPDLEGKPAITTLRHVRISDERASEWVERLIDLAQDFIEEPRGGSTVYGLLVGLFPTDRPSLGEDPSRGTPDDGQ